MESSTKVVKITGRAVPVVGDDIDTDRIIPARYLKEITFSRMGEYPFYDERFNPDGSRKKHPFNEEHYQGASILLANANFGCGSSREHAPQALARWGIKAVIAETFAEIFSGNCTMIGVPTLAASKDDANRLQKLAASDPTAQFSIDLEKMEVTARPSERGATARGATGGGAATGSAAAGTATGSSSGSGSAAGSATAGAFTVKLTMPEPRRNALIEGTWDSTSLLVANLDKVRKTAAALPYVHV